MPIEVACPACGAKLRVRDELLGKRVKCPKCQDTFTAEASEDDLPPPPTARRAVPRDDEDEDERPARRSRRDDDDDDEDDRPRRRSRRDDEDRPRRRRRRGSDLASVKPPAICLLVVGVLALLIDIWNIIATMGNQGKRPPMGPEVPAFLRQAAEFNAGPMGLVLAFLFLFMSIAVVAGCATALNGKLYPLAIVASIAGMLHIQCGCCILGLPFGIWLLIVLLNQEVRAAFD